MPIPVITSIISAVSIIVGSLVGAFCSYKISTKMYKKQVSDEHSLMIENREFEERFKVKQVCDNANIIRLDITTAIYQSIRSLQNNSEIKKYLYLLPINKNYSSAVASLSHKFNLKELSYIYQLYGIIEKVNRDIYNWNIGDSKQYENVEIGFEAILYKLYGENYDKLINIDTESITYEELYNNSLIEKHYKEILAKLDDVCILDNLLSVKNSY